MAGRLRSNLVPVSARQVEAAARGPVGSGGAGRQLPLPGGRRARPLRHLDHPVR